MIYCVATKSKTFAEQIRFHSITLRRAGFSQEAFAKKINIHVSNLSKYERNISIPSLEIAKNIATVLEVSIDTLVFGNRNLEDDINDNELASLFKKAQQLSDKQKETVKDFLSAFVLKADLTQKLAQ